tara:strand:+ start:92 stop:1030 length:939 start_codon:yes stop_codon:yes gene_type:complete
MWRGVVSLKEKRMTIFELMTKFSTEEICRLDFKRRRESHGVNCKKCGCSKQYWLKSKWQWQCSNCNFRTGLRSGSFMEHSKLPFLTWYRAMILFSFSKKGLSAKEIQRQLKSARYESVWSMVHRLRKAMSKANKQTKLSGTIEFDEGYFSVGTKSFKYNKRGRGSKKKAKVAVMAESIPLENVVTGKKFNWLGNFKMEVIDGHGKNKIDQLLENKIVKNSVLITDKSTSYNGLEMNFEHYSSLSSDHTTANTLKWVHIGISNAKRKLLGINHTIKKEYLQGYLDEFCFKINRRKQHGNMMFHLLDSVSLNYW